MSEPRPELFADVAEQFEQMAQPLSMEWMEKRHVSLEELQALSQQVALILRGYLALSPRDRIAFVSQGIFHRTPTAVQPAETALGKRQKNSNGKHSS